MKAIIFAILLQLLFLVQIKAQFEDYYWVSGQNAAIQFDLIQPFISNFSSSPFNVISSFNNSSICNKTSGDLLMYCDGSRIYNKLGFIMDNGDSINPGQYLHVYYPDGISVFDGTLILPNIYHNNQYIVFYTNVDSFIPGVYLPTKLYYSLVDMSYYNGLGKVIQKDVIVLNHLLEPGRLNAIQHANGRDWWLVVNGFIDNQHFIYLVDYTGIHLVHTQTIRSPLFQQYIVIINVWSIKAERNWYIYIAL